MAWLVVGGILLTIGDIVMKEWVNTDSKLYFAIGLFFYLVSLICLAMTFREKNIAIASMMLIIFNVVILAVVSWVFFKEPLSTKELVGIGLGIATIILLESA